MPNNAIPKITIKIFTFVFQVFVIDYLLLQPLYVINKFAFLISLWNLR